MTRLSCCSAPIDVPDFTNGKWQSKLPVEMGASSLE